jgi:hypothetical protein
LHNGWMGGRLGMLIEKLQAIQGTYGWSDAEMAARLGIKPRMWGYVKEGRYRLSKRSLACIGREFAGLREDVWAYLQDELRPTAARVEQAA